MIKLSINDNLINDLHVDKLSISINEPILLLVSIMFSKYGQFTEK